MDDSSRITYTPRPDATPEGELNALAAVYAFVLKCGEEKNQTPFIFGFDAVFAKNGYRFPEAPKQRRAA